jgi:hypothetical protein
MCARRGPAGVQPAARSFPKAEHRHCAHVSNRAAQHNRRGRPYHEPVIELPAGWLIRFNAAPDKAAFLRDWGAELCERARWATDTERVEELLEAAGGAFGAALQREPAPGPAHGDHVHTFSGRLWPHPGCGPWLVVLKWQIIDGKPVCIGLELSSSRGDVATTGSEITEQLPPIGLPLTAKQLRSMRLAEILREDWAELVEVAAQAKAAAQP